MIDYQEYLEFHRESYADAVALSGWAVLPVEQWPEAWFTYNEKRYPRAEQIRLEKPDGGRAALSHGRFSSRVPLKTITLKELTYLLWRTTHDDSAPTHQRAEWHRPYPSAGGRLSCEIYVLARSVEGLESGVYSYNVRDHVLYQVREDLDQKFVHTVFGSDWVSDTGAIFAITASMDRLLVKYGPRSYRYALMEVGSLAQTLCLVAGGRAIGTCLLGGFADVPLAQLLMCTPGSEFPMVAVAVSSIDEE